MNRFIRSGFLGFDLLQTIDLKQNFCRVEAPSLAAPGWLYLMARDRRHTVNRLIHRLAGRQKVAKWSRAVTRGCFD
ncbi:MAG: hypothetical protein WAV67_05755 [Dokdonella sp.]